MTGILCLNKPQEMTSFACCAAVRRLCGERRVGHAGTLDPMATGVLPILLGRATRAIPLFPSHDKAYRATVRFGATSTTQDVWGEVTPTGRPLPTIEQLRAVLPRFEGTIQQVPPMMSACKKDGVRLYDLARQGITVEREARTVTVHRLTVEGYDPRTGELTFLCACSAGTYIRTLGADMGEALGCGAVLTALHRTEAAGFTLADCHTLDEWQQFAAAGTLLEHLLPVEHAFLAYPAVSLTAAQTTRFVNGGELSLARLGGQSVAPTVRVRGADGRFLGLATPSSESLHPLRLLCE